MSEISPDGAADIIIPVCNQYAYTRNLLDEVYRYTDFPFHVYVIDNASTDETIDLHKIFTRNITIVRNHKSRGWGASANQGIELGSNPYLVFMHNTIGISRKWLEKMIAFLDTHPRIGAVGPLNSNPNDDQFIDRIRQKIAPQIPSFLTEDIHERNRILDYHFHGAGILIEGILNFSCLVIKRRIINEIGLLDESLVGGGDGEAYCRRLRKAGYVLGLSLNTYISRQSAAGSKIQIHENPRESV